MLRQQVFLCHSLNTGFLVSKPSTDDNKSCKSMPIFSRCSKTLTTFATEYLSEVKFNPLKPIEVLAITYFIRGLMTFQSLMVLLEQGCIEDAVALCRTLLQGYYRLAAIAADPTVINRIFATAVNDQKRRFEFYKSDRLKLPANVTIDLDAKIAEAEAEIKKLGGVLPSKNFIWHPQSFCVLPPKMTHPKSLS